MMLLSLGPVMQAVRPRRQQRIWAPKCCLITMNLQTIAQMSCNPAMGGVAKGQIVREIDAMGGYSGIVTDKTMIQFRMLNKSKGPAMWSPRAQSDRMLICRYLERNAGKHTKCRFLSGYGQWAHS